MKSAYKVDYQGLNPEIIEGLRDCTIDAIDDSLIFVDDIDSIAIDNSNMSIDEYTEEFDTVYCFSNKYNEY